MNFQKAHERFSILFLLLYTCLISVSSDLVYACLIRGVWRTVCQMTKLFISLNVFQIKAVLLVNNYPDLDHMNSSAVLVREALHFLIFLSVRLRVPQWCRLGQLGGPSLCPAGLCSFASLRRLEAWCVSHCPCAELSRAGPSSVSALLSTPTPPSTSAPHDYAEVSSPGDRPLVTMWGHLAQGAPMTMWGCLAPGSPCDYVGVSGPRDPRPMTVWGVSPSPCDYVGASGPGSPL